MDTNILTNKFFQALHCPKGANAFFALGLLGSGGFGNCNDYIPRQNIYIGLSSGGKIKCLPFFSQKKENWFKDYMIGGVDDNDEVISVYPAKEITREYNAATDIFKTGDFKFEIASLTDGMTDPEKASYNSLKFDTAPFVAVRFTVDNSKGSEKAEAFFIIDALSRGAQDICHISNGEYCGIIDKRGYAISARCDDGAKTVHNNDLSGMLIEKKENFTLSRSGGIVVEVQPFVKKTFDIVIAFYAQDSRTTGQVSADFAYKKYFTDIMEVIDYGFSNIEKVFEKAYNLDNDRRLLKLNPYKQFLINHSKRSYYASSMLFADGLRYRYVVNEGTFMMMNTFDLTVDHLVFEADVMPWAVKNQLESFIDEYSYYDNLHYRGGENIYPGGISFTHDQGVAGYFTPKGYSSYEVPHWDGCFSYMTAEQLSNFVLCAGVYFSKTNDTQWLRKRRNIIEDCLISMMNRDNPDESERNGIMSFDSSRCVDGSEITTYDSLDKSLGQARNNLYIASKFFAAYLILEKLLNVLGEKSNAQKAYNQAVLCSGTITASFDKKTGQLPAIISEGNDTALIPVAEGLVYLYLCKDTERLKEFSELTETYRKHLTAVLKKGVCLFEGNGWRLSQSNTNSWMSKIFINQFVAKNILGLDISHCDEDSDMEHARWWADGCKESPCVDQIFEGETDTSGFHYPRGVTSHIWLCES